MEVKQFVDRYLETTGSDVVEKQPGYVTVRLSPTADRALTNRPYYWNFVDRTGVEPETMTFTFVLDPAAAPEPNRPNTPQPGGQINQMRTIVEPLSFGSARLNQM